MTPITAEPDTARPPSKVVNPATGAVIREVANMSAGEVATVVASARAAQPAWEALGFAGRAAVLRAARAWMVKHADRFVEALVVDTGKPHEEAQLEVLYAASALGHWAKHAPRYLADERIRSRSPFAIGRRLAVTYRPRGVIGVIGPWNVPLMNSFGDCIPALAAGNAVVLKPSEVTPLAALLALEMMRAAGAPDGVYGVATGDGETGAALIDGVDFVHFTGSVATGRKVAHRAIDSLTPYTLELGGKDPLIVLADADLERAANAAVFYAMSNAGQICLSVERVYVEAPVHDEFVELVRTKVQALRQGASAGPGSIDVGPMIFEPQADKVEAHVDDARQRGARVLTGGHARRDGGVYFEPTVLTDVDHDMECMREETFGPTLPIMRVADVDEAVLRANDSPYGLAATVFTRDAAKGEATARRLKAGTVNVNDAWMSYFVFEVPMGGEKESGIGARHGAEGIRKYCHKQAVMVNRITPRRDLAWFPYTGRSARVVALALRLVGGRRRNA